MQQIMDDEDSDGDLDTKSQILRLMQDNPLAIHNKPMDHSSIKTLGVRTLIMTPPLPNKQMDQVDITDIEEPQKYCHEQHTQDIEVFCSGTYIPPSNGKKCHDCTLCLKLNALGVIVVEVSTL